MTYIPPPSEEPNAENDAVSEYEVLDLLYEALSDDVPANLYDTRPDLPRTEFYVEVRGECWRVFAEPHPHVIPPGESNE